MEKELDIIEKVKRALPSDDVLYDLADLFKMFGDSTRAKILGCLGQADLCGWEVAGDLGVAV